MKNKIIGSIVAGLLLSSPIIGASPASAATSQISSTDAKKILAKGEAYQDLHVPYRWGGTTVKGMDCSGLTYHIYAVLGKKIPRVANDQYRSSHKVSSPKPGDLVFVYDSRGYVYHVSIYVNSHTWLASERPGEGVGYYKPWTKRVHYGYYSLK